MLLLLKLCSKHLPIEMKGGVFPKKKEFKFKLMSPMNGRPHERCLVFSKSMEIDG